MIGPDKPFSCSFRDYDGVEFGFEIYAYDHDDAERRLERLRGNAVVLGEIMHKWPASTPFWLVRLRCWMGNL